MIYRKRFSGTAARTTFSLTQETLDGLKKIRTAFGMRYPKDRYPTLSLVLEQVLTKNLRELQENPEFLADEIEEFERRYAKRRK
ncbi:MAG TPA: hypothetical protein VN039_12350 [Nitrospira sp.]|nr:hypothetical protein [Nitrospira sp.]